MSWKNYTRSHENNGNRPSSELFMIRKRLFLRATIFFFFFIISYEYVNSPRNNLVWFSFEMIKHTNCTFEFYK